MFARDDLNCIAIWAKLRERGWVSGIVTEPLGLHLMLSPVHAETGETYLADLAWAVDAVSRGGVAKGAAPHYS